MTEIEICTINGTKWLLGNEAPERMNWERAKAWCDSIGQQLPPREVLLMAYLNPEIRCSFANYYYWSSTEDGSDGAWLQNFNNGYQDSATKPSTFLVRAVRAIKGLTPREALTEYKKGYARAELDLKREPLSDDAIINHLYSFDCEIPSEYRQGFEYGVEYAEQKHGITGGEE
jgi:hypothetical protein